MMNNKPLLIYNLSECILNFTYDNFCYVLDKTEVGIQTISWLQKHYWNFPQEDFVALVLTDEASYQKEALLVFSTGVFHGYPEKEGVFLRFTDIQNWNITEDILSITTKNGTYLIKPTKISPLSIALLLDACRSEAKNFCFKHVPKTGRKKTPYRSERLLLNKNFKSSTERNFCKIATNNHEEELSLRCLADQKQRGLSEINSLLSLYYKK